MRKVKYIVPAVATTVVTAVPAFAESTGGTANAQVTSAMQTIANDMIATGNAVIPIALTVIGIGMVVTFGIKIFTRVVGTRK